MEAALCRQREGAVAEVDPALPPYVRSRVIAAIEVGQYWEHGGFDWNATTFAEQYAATTRDV